MFPILPTNRRLFLAQLVLPGLTPMTTLVNPLCLLDRPPHILWRPILCATVLPQPIRGPFRPYLIPNLCPRWLTTTLKRSLFTLETTARFARLLARMANAGLLLVSPVKLPLSPVTLVRDPGLIVTETIALGNATVLKMTGSALLYSALFAWTLPKFMFELTLLVVTLLMGPRPPERTRKR